MLDPVIHMILIMAVALVFLNSAWHKLSSRSTFREQLADYHILPVRLLPVTALLLPALELVGIILFISTFTHAMGTTILVALTLLYTAAIALNLYRGRTEMDCGCFGGDMQQPISAQLLLRNMVLLGFILSTLLEVSARPLLWLDWLTAGFGMAVLTVFYATANRLLINGQLLKRLTN